MKIPLIEMLKNRGVHQGLGQTSNSMKMAALILLPLIGPWFAVQIFCTKEQASLYTPIVFGAWIASIVIYFYAKKATAADYSLFPQSHWQFPDGQQLTFDLFVLPNRGEGENGWEPLTIKDKPIIYPDGSQLFKVVFKDKYVYQDPYRDTPDIFDEALVKTPASWQESFDFNGFGEFFMDGLFITSSHCENISITVIEWDERGGSRIPICIVSSCSWYHKQVRQYDGKVLPKAEMKKLEAKEVIIADVKKRNSRLLTRNEYLEIEAERHDQEEPAIIKERVDKEVDAVLHEYSDVMNIKPSLMKRLWRNAKYLFYFGIVALVALFAAWLLGLI